MLSLFLKRLPPRIPIRSLGARAFSSRDSNAGRTGISSAKEYHLKKIAQTGPVVIKEEPRETSVNDSSNDPSAMITGTGSASSMERNAHPAHHYINGGTPCDPTPPPFHLADHGEESLYTLVLLRHGESEWNLQNRFTGWCDVELTERGRSEAQTAGRLLYENGIELDHAFTSVLRRASFSCNIVSTGTYLHSVSVYEPTLSLTTPMYSYPGSRIC